MPEAELHRVRGEILLKRDPANPGPSEEAFLTAISVAKQQGTRSFQLRARCRSPSSTNRPVANPNWSAGYTIWRHLTSSALKNHAECTIRDASAEDADAPNDRDRVTRGTPSRVSCGRSH